MVETKRFVVFQFSDCFLKIVINIHINFIISTLNLNITIFISQTLDNN